ncbi:MAG: CRTAC1 family protein, partial [Gemmataceae bacterium]
DLDNDGQPDLILAGFPGVKLYRNIGGGKLEDITRQGGLEAAKGVYTAAAVVDLDQDSDLDLLLAEYQATPEGGDGGLRVWLHVGEAVPLGIGQKPGPPLQCRYRPAEEKSGLSFTGKLLNLVLSDVDGDRDVDLVLLPDGQAPRLLVNDRLLRFRSLPMSLPAERWLGGLSLDGTHSGRSDLLLLAEGKPPRWLLSKCKPGLQQPEDVVFDAGPITSPALRQAGVVDIDLDGWADVLGLTPEGQVLLLHNEAGRLVQRPDTFATVSLPAGVNAALPVVLNLSAKDPQPELLLASSTGLAIVGVEKSKNHGLLVQLSGRMAIESGGMVVRCNADAIGTQVVAQTQELWTSQENATLSAGPGQSRQPLLLGLGGHTTADVVRLRWPDGTLQAELDLASGLARIPQANRKKTSCPVLFTWDGKQYRFVTDMLGAGALGELLIDGSTRMPRPEESVKIEADQLAPRDGHYELVLAEPMDEITYLDALRLEVVDHPRELSVFPDERFATGGKPPTQKIIAFGPRIFPEKARDHRGQDLHSTLSRWDREMARGFARRAWIGFAEEHFVELDFGAQVAKLPAGPLYLCLAGWTDYPFPESIWAANQAGVPMKPPVLERRDASGKWVPLAEVGFPAGLPRMMLLDVSDLPREPGCVLRLRTNLHIYWDQIFLARPEDASRIRTRTLPPVLARLDACGLHQEYSPDGLPPTVFAHDRFDNAPVVRHLGRMTRHGDVLPLLNETDDAFVIFGPQDRLQVHFDAKQLPALPEGWTRSYVLRAWGYCKDTGPFTATGSTVEPLPYRGMKAYPPTGPEAPKSALGESYRTREIRPEREGPRQR